MNDNPRRVFSFRFFASVVDSMKRAWKTFGGFWIAEEVPRWFGLSLVLIYLAGIGAVAHFEMLQAQREANASSERSFRYAVGALAEQLLARKAANPAEAAPAEEDQFLLERFASRVPTKILRLVDANGRIVASIASEEVGKPSSNDLVEGPFTNAAGDIGAPSGALEKPARLIRIPLGSTSGKGESTTGGPISPAGAGHDPASDLWLVACAVLPKAPTLLSSAGALTVVLLVLGALFAVHRRLRGQLRGISRVADRLRLNRDRLATDLGSLRVTDTFDHMTEAWNQLIDSAQGWFDTVQRTQANEELSRVLQRSGGGALSDALNAVPDGFLFITNEVRFEYVNSTVARLFGWSHEEARRITLPEAHAEGIGGEVLAIVRGALQADGSFEARTQVLEGGDEQASNRSSYRVWVIPLQRIRHQGECVVLIRDVSQQIQADRAREEFVTQVTHELRTPLTNIRAYTETLSSGMFDDPKVISECYNVITKETRRLSRLIEDILSVSQLEVGSIELTADNVDLRTLLSDGVRDVRGLADEKNIDLQMLAPAKLEPINADRDKLAVVINNLLANAIKYTPNGGNVIVGCQFTADAAVLTFKDNGIGIDAADHARIFEKFQRADDPAVQQETGTGIGLYTAREIVRRHGGDIELISAKGQGSTFLVRLPHRGGRATALSTTQEA